MASGMLSAFAVYKQTIEKEGKKMDEDERPKGPGSGKKRQRLLGHQSASSKKKRLSSTKLSPKSPGVKKSTSKWESNRKTSSGKKTVGKTKMIQKQQKQKLFSEETSFDSNIINSEVEDNTDQEEDQSPAKLLPSSLPQDHFSTPFKLLFNPDVYDDSREAANALFELLIQPYPIDKFYSEVWEKKPILLSRKSTMYNEGWFSCRELDKILCEHNLEYSVNINITSYQNDEKVIKNQPGRAYASAVWQFFSEGYSIQFLNPQSYSDTMWLLNATLQEHFSSFVGANIYITPANTQGFSPHYDDIEAFIMQIEGKKRWRLYKPRNRYEILPRVSSKNFQQNEIGEPILDVTLEPGDLLYFPRGVIHQASSLADEHSLHITLSTCQKNTWGDLLEKMVPVALQTAIEEDEEFRHSLPSNYLDFMGVVHSDESSTQKQSFMDKLCDLMSRIVQYAPMEAAVDQMGLEFIHSSLPPYLTDKDRSAGIWTQGPRLNDQGQIEGGIEITVNSKVKLIRSKALRLVTEEELGPVLYYTTNNSRIYKEKDQQGMTIHLEDAPAVEILIQSYPNYIIVNDLPLEKDQEKVDICYVLYNHGLLFVED